MDSAGGAGELLEAAAAELVAALASAAERAVAQRVSGEYGVEGRHQQQVLNLGGGCKGHRTSDPEIGSRAKIDDGRDVEMSDAGEDAYHAAAAGPAGALAAAAVARAAGVKVEGIEPMIAGHM